MDELTTLNGRRALVIDHQLQRIPDSRKADWPLGEDVTDLGNGFWLCPPKTDSGERIVVLDDVMCGALDEWLAIRRQKGVDSPMLFVTGRGTPIDRRIEYFHWDKALLRIGIVNGEDGVRLRPHSARHTADTLFANAGVPESARLALMGHSDAAMDNVYLHADTCVSPIPQSLRRRRVNRQVRHPLVQIGAADAHGRGARVAGGHVTVEHGGPHHPRGYAGERPGLGHGQGQFVAQRRLLDMACHALACASQGIRQK